jgi:heme-degrading monooxygenase HmoA
MFLVLWEFEVKPGYEARYESVYGPRGAWARLFEQDSAYLGTHLFRDTNRPRIYLTLDQWSSRGAYEEFRQRHAAEYSSLDAQGEMLTQNERHLASVDADSSAGRFR